MSSETFSLVFRGDIVATADIAAVKRRAMALFAMDEARVERLFSGKPLPLKKNLTQAAAETYKQQLHKAGLIVFIEAADKAPATDHLSLADNTGHLVKDSERADVGAAPVGDAWRQWTLSPPGEPLLRDAERPTVDVVAVAVDHLSLVEQPKPP
ncbi:MAG: hypothetical protein KTR20_07700 [Cellvibrionaceae bacterium]|nr:hypothetical protein [Cellvibrionaceae bacterium]